MSYCQEEFLRSFFPEYFGGVYSTINLWNQNPTTAPTAVRFLGTLATGAVAIGLAPTAAAGGNMLAPGSQEGSQLDAWFYSMFIFRS
jgi:hypothetical protein